MGIFHKAQKEPPKKEKFEKPDLYWHHGAMKFRWVIAPGEIRARFDYSDHRFCVRLTCFSGDLKDLCDIARSAQRYIDEHIREFYETLWEVGEFCFYTPYRSCVVTITEEKDY